MREIVILGAGGLAREVAFLIEDINRVIPTWKIVGFVEATRERVGSTVGKFPVAFCDEDIASQRIAVALGIGSPDMTSRLVSKLAGLSNLEFPNLVHPGTTWDAERVLMGRGNIICAGNILTTDITIGSFNFLNLASTYGHDVVIDDCCVINPGVNVSGGVKIGRGCLIGTGAAILQYVSIGNSAIVGAGAVVVKDVEPGTTVVGVPARPVEAHKHKNAQENRQKP